MTSRGRKKTTGRYETRAELEEYVCWAYFATPMKTSQIARAARISDCTAAKIINAEIAAGCPNAARFRRGGP